MELEIIHQDNDLDMITGLPIFKSFGTLGELENTQNSPIDSLPAGLVPCNSIPQNSFDDFDDFGFPSSYSLGIPPHVGPLEFIDNAESLSWGNSSTLNESSDSGFGGLSCSQEYYSQSPLSQSITSTLNSNQDLSDFSYSLNTPSFNSIQNLNSSPVFFPSVSSPTLIVSSTAVIPTAALNNNNLSNSNSTEMGLGVSQERRKLKKTKIDKNCIDINSVPDHVIQSIKSKRDLQTMRDNIITSCKFINEKKHFYVRCIPKILDAIPTWQEYHSFKHKDLPEPSAAFGIVRFAELKNDTISVFFTQGEPIPERLVDIIKLFENGKLEIPKLSIVVEYPYLINLHWNAKGAVRQMIRDYVRRKFHKKFPVESVDSTIQGAKQEIKQQTRDEAMRLNIEQIKIQRIESKQMTEDQSIDFMECYCDSKFVPMKQLFSEEVIFGLNTIQSIEKQKKYWHTIRCLEEKPILLKKNKKDSTHFNDYITLAKNNFRQSIENPETKNTKPIKKSQKENNNGKQNGLTNVISVVPHSKKNNMDKSLKSTPTRKDQVKKKFFIQRKTTNELESLNECATESPNKNNNSTLSDSNNNNNSDNNDIDGNDINDINDVNDIKRVIFDEMLQTMDTVETIQSLGKIKTISIIESIKTPEKTQEKTQTEESENKKVEETFKIPEKITNDQIIETLKDSEVVIESQVEKEIQKENNSTIHFETIVEFQNIDQGNMEQKNNSADNNSIIIIEKDILLESDNNNDSDNVATQSETKKDKKAKGIKNKKQIENRVVDKKDNGNENENANTMKKRITILKNPTRFQHSIFFTPTEKEMEQEKEVLKIIKDGDFKKLTERNETKLSSSYFNQSKIISETLRKDMKYYRWNQKEQIDSLKNTKCDFCDNNVEFISWEDGELFDLKSFFEKYLKSKSPFKNPSKKMNKIYNYSLPLHFPFVLKDKVSISHSTVHLNDNDKNEKDNNQNQCETENSISVDNHEKTTAAEGNATSMIVDNHLDDEKKDFVDPLSYIPLKNKRKLDVEIDNNNNDNTVSDETSQNSKDNDSDKSKNENQNQNKEKEEEEMRDILWGFICPSGHITCMDCAKRKLYQWYTNENSSYINYCECFAEEDHPIDSNFSVRCIHPIDDRVRSWIVSEMYTEQIIVAEKYHIKSMKMSKYFEAISDRFISIKCEIENCTEIHTFDRLKNPPPLSLKCSKKKEYFCLVCKKIFKDSKNQQLEIVNHFKKYKKCTYYLMCYSPELCKDADTIWDDIQNYCLLKESTNLTQIFKLPISNAKLLYDTKMIIHSYTHTTCPRCSHATSILYNDQVEPNIISSIRHPSRYFQKYPWVQLKKEEDRKEKTPTPQKKLKTTKNQKSNSKDKKKHYEFILTCRCRLTRCYYCNVIPCKDQNTREMLKRETDKKLDFTDETMEEHMDSCQVKKKFPTLKSLHIQKLTVAEEVVNAKTKLFSIDAFKTFNSITYDETRIFNYKWS